ncbi:MAG TPA: lysylphosphatidylglycerol synthase domain-containing protein [Solirubrobacteraceae bacterium]|nr:lysylphosphatidylglycerol synthase domain-containing protein [Solirubrobacteraceae bacterium]
MIADGEPEDVAARQAPSAHARHTWHALRAARGHLAKSVLRLLGYALFALLVLKLIPGLTQALRSLQHVSWQWLAGAIAVETLSEFGFVVSWRAILDPEDLLGRDSRGGRLARRVAWAQLGGGMLVPGGSLASIGVGSWILHRLGMPTSRIAERQFNLSFLNTAVDALALILFGLGLATGVFAGAGRLSLTLLPAAIGAIGLAAVLLIARRASNYARRLEKTRPRAARAITALADAVDDTQRLLFRRGGRRTVLGAIAYLGFDTLVLYAAFYAVHAHPVPGYAVVVMAYIIGALGGSLPLPASAGAIGGITAMLIVYGVNHSAAVAAVILYEAIGLLVPLVGGGIAYLFLRQQFGAMTDEAASVEVGVRAA